MNQSSRGCVSFPFLGSYGRLGNQMFQYASLKGIANKNNYDLLIPKNRHSLNCFSLPFSSIETDTIERHFSVIYSEPDSDLRFNPALFKIPDRVALKGYFQNTNYFDHISDELRREFTFKREILDKSFLEINKLYSRNQIPVSVHIRRTDYLKFPEVFQVTTQKYYQEAIKLIKSRISNPVFIFFTDDKEWVGQNYGIYSISNNDIPEIDLCMMSLCHHHIICNSSFSWWGAWLAKSQRQIVIRPKKWFGPMGPIIDEGMFCKEWEQLDAA